MGKRKSRWKKPIVACVILLILLYVIFFMPLPFISALWEADIFRYRMEWDVSRRVMGLQGEEIILMLGEAEALDWYPTAWVYRIGPQSWRSLIIFFDENGVAVRTATGNPLHF